MSEVLKILTTISKGTLKHERVKEAQPHVAHAGNGNRKFGFYSLRVWDRGQVKYTNYPAASLQWTKKEIVKKKQAKYVLTH